MAQTPDVRVRLSAEGVQEVIAAMQKVQAEAKKTDGVKALNQAFSDLKGELLGGFGVVAAVASIAELGKKAVENAVNISLLSEKTGASTEMLSVLSLAAQRAEVSQEDLGNGLVKLAKSMDQAAQGSAKPLDAFKRLGIGMKDIKTLDPGQMFVLIAQKMEGVESPTKRAALAQDLLSKSGANLLPVMQQLANGGFEQLQEKALRMGLVLSQQTVEDIRHAHDAMQDLGNIAEGVATQFLSGFAPKAADAMENFGNAVSQNGVNGMQKLGEYVGYIAKGIVFVFTVVGQTIGAVIGSIVQAVITAWDETVAYSKGTIDALKALRQGDFAGAKKAFNDGVNRGGEIERAGQSTQNDIYSHLGGQYKDAFSKLTAPDSTPVGNGRGKGGGTDDAGNIAAIQKARLAYLQAQADNELAITKTKLQLEGQVNDISYKNGLTDLQDYYDKRGQLIDDEMDAEISDLQKKRALLEKQETDNPADELKKQQQIEAINTKITETILQRDGKIKANEDARHQAVIEHRTQELELEQKIATAEGDRDKAAQLALQVELSRTEELLQKQGMAADQIKKVLDDMRSAGEGKIGFDSASRQGSLAMSDLDLAKRDIQRQAETGQISDIQAQGQILQLERERIDTLQQIGVEMTANAEKSKDPSLIEQAKQFNAAVKDLEASTDQVGIAMAQLKNQVINGGINAISQFIGDAVSGAKSFKDAWADLGKAFQQIVAQMIAKLIELMLIQLLLKTIMGGDDGGSGLVGNIIGNGFMDDGSFGGLFASGGWTGDMARNKIAGVVHGQEYVVKAGPAARFLPLLEAMNAGSMRGITPMGGWGYMSGGYVSGQGGSPVEVNVINNTGQEVTQQQTQTPDGRTVIDLVVGKVAADIASGGKVSQAIDATYAIRRAGRKRV